VTETDPRTEPAPADLLEIAAHDAIQPLHSIKLQLDLLARKLQKGEISTEAVLETLLIMSRRTSTLAAQLRSAIQARRDGSSAYVVHVTRCDFTAIINGVIKQFDPGERERIILTGHERVLEGYWDGDRIAQVIRELVENAFKYSPEGSQVRIEIESNGEVALTVQDCGVGLTLSELQNLFRPSYRSERVVEVAGTGLGLYASRVIVEAHGGRIWAESRGAGQGSAFHIVLPR